MEPFFKKFEDVSLWLSFTGMATFILFFISPDSYLSGMQGRIDSAWFFMGGKAWMNGLVPYVDFSDSKGPLLWLIYGVGYLLSPTTYHGVFWISCFWYGVTFLFTFKTAHIFLPEKRKALFCAVLMSLAYFNPWFHSEVRAEDFAMLFMVISLYEMVRLVWTDCHDNLRRFLIMGCCFSALLLIKFNIAFMQALLILAALIAKTPKRGLWRQIGSCALGAFLVGLPFLIYFLFQGNLIDFFQEYFLRTGETVSQAYNPYGGSSLLERASETRNLGLIYLCEWTCILDNPRIGALLLLLLIGGILFAQQSDSHPYLALLVSLGVFAISIRHNLIYYFMSCSPFLLFLLIGLLRNASLRRIRICAILSLTTLVVCIAAHVFLVNYRILGFRDTVEKQGYSQMAEIISQINHPTIVNAFDNETGIGTKGEALPAGKYWSYQAGSTPQMIEEHKALILSGKADFVYIRRPGITEQRGLTMGDLEQAGYRIVCLGGELADSVLLTNRTDLKL